MNEPTMSAPDYKSHDPKGWCGDPRRGAAMGRGSYHADDKQAPVKLYLRHVPLNGDYDSNGTYFGGGYGTLPLYWCADGSGDVDFMLRARDRNDAKRQVLEEYRQARFYR